LLRYLKKIFYNSVAELRLDTKTSTLIFTSMAKLAAYAEPAIMMPG
jgi:hypothetical protein